MLARPLKKILRHLVPVTTLESAVALSREGSALVEHGWFQSFKKKKPMDKNGNPLPWMTYAFIDFIGPRLKKSFDVFEYGCGYSSLFFADRVRSVISVEHNEDWFREMQSRIPGNVKIVYHELIPGGEYSKAATKQDLEFDLVIVDGRDRVNCVKAILASDCLGERGVIIVDNSERESYKPAYLALRECGYRRIDFHGMGPINTYSWCTSVFYRNENVLGL